VNSEDSSTFSADILAVDDVPENLKLLLNLLTPPGYKVRPASNGAEALDAVMSKKPDLILLDIKMPGMDGFEVCKRLKSDRQTNKIPIIFISALDETDDIVKAFHAGGVDYITKPFQEQEVLMRVQTHLELQRIRMNLERTVAERNKALDEVKTLRGIIPICAYCHQIRDDEGEWKKLEAYILEHSHDEAEFSHGVCPGCYKKQMEEIEKDD
jgi:PleD family two-component response regulator